MRVGNAGYIEVPSALSERVFGWDFHLWYCEKDGNRLVLRKSRKVNNSTDFSPADCPNNLVPENF